MQVLILNTGNTSENVNKATIFPLILYLLLVEHCHSHFTCVSSFFFWRSPWHHRVLGSPRRGRP